MFFFDNYFIILHRYDALKDMNEVSTCDENFSEEMKKMQQTRYYIILTSKAHSHEAELGVQKISHKMLTVNRSELVGTTVSVTESHCHQIVTH